MESSMWVPFTVKMTFLNELCAGLPANLETLKGLLEARKPKYQPPGTKSIQEIAEQFVNETLSSLKKKEKGPEVPEDSDEEEPVEKTLHVFERRTRPDGDPFLVVGMRTLRAHIKDCSKTLSTLYIGKVEGQKSFAVKVKAALYYPPQVEYVPILGPDGQPVTAPTDVVLNKPIRIQTPKGERSALKSYEYLRNVTIEWPICVMQTIGEQLVVPEQDINIIFEYGGTHGYGPERGDGKGRYVATITRMQT